MPVAAKFQSDVNDAVDTVVDLGRVYGVVTAQVMVADDVHVPSHLHGAYVVTGKGFTYHASNLARALVTLRSVRNAQTIWLTVNGKRTRVAYK